MLSLLESASPEEVRAFKLSLFQKMRVELPQETADRVGIKRGTDGRISYMDGVLKHPGQKLIHFPTPEQEWRYHVACWGRRAAKTIAAAGEATFELALRKRRIWIVAPTYTLTDRVFEWVWEWVVRQKVLGKDAVAKAHYTKDRRYIEMKESAGGSFIQGMSGEAPDSCLGEQLNLLIVDEAARLGENLWLQNLEPTTVDRQGRTLFISTPQGRTWFKTYFERGEDSETRAKGWRSSRVRSWENPFVPRSWLASKRSETPDLIWNQEYGASFEDRAGLIWPEFKPFLWPKGHLYDPAEVELSSKTHYMGIDIGFRLPTAAVWGAVDPKGDIYVYRDYEEVQPSHEDHAEQIRTLSTYPVNCRWISPDAKRRSKVRKISEDSPWKIYREKGLFCRPAADDRQAGWSAVAAYLRATLDDKSTHPRLFVSKECKLLEKRLLDYTYKEIESRKDADQPEEPRKLHDHLPDALRFLVVARPKYHQKSLEELERYGYQNSVYAREQKRGVGGRVRGIPGLATCPAP